MGISVHKLRHTAATLMYQNGVDVVVVDAEGYFVTVMKGGGDNKRYRNAVRRSWN